MAKHVNTSLKLKFLASELEMTQFQIDPYLENNNNIVEASFKLLIDWKNQIVCTETSWKNILEALYHAQVFPSVQHLTEFCSTLFNI